MLAWLVTIVLVLFAGLGWLALKKKIEPIYTIVYTPVNWLWFGGSNWHHTFNILVNMVIVVGVFAFYKYILDASSIFSFIVAILLSMGISAGKEMLDKYIQKDDIIACLTGIGIGALLTEFF